VHLADGTVVSLLGELDMDSAPRLEEVLDELPGEGPPEIVIDLSELSFLDSTGLGTLIRAQKSLMAQGRRLNVRSPRPAQLRVFEVTDLLDFLNVDIAQPPRS
jgi:anti-anti-sigma factor